MSDKKQRTIRVSAALIASVLKNGVGLCAPQVPKDVRIVDVCWQPMEDEIWLIVEGDFTPEESDSQGFWTPAFNRVSGGPTQGGVK